MVFITLGEDFFLARWIVAFAGVFCKKWGAQRGVLGGETWCLSMVNVVN
jgi:hypothetical protein